MDDTRRATRALGLVTALAAVTSLAAPAAFAAPAEKPVTASPAKKAPKGMKDDFNGNGAFTVGAATFGAKPGMFDEFGAAYTR
ncbi:hypothetical protein [Streptomyces sp. NPDC014894]|uniref:hypothetical protein n=1 Tax=Streptomyces sp. NPDC014894 TaxID=3364931 RepID=UPI0036FDC119